MTTNAASSPPEDEVLEAVPNGTSDETTSSDAAGGAAKAGGAPRAATAGDRAVVAAEPVGPDPAGLHARAQEARERLKPERTAIPAPRSPQGVTVPAAFGSSSDDPPADIVAALDQLVADLAAVRVEPDAPAHHALVRLGELTVAGVPEQGWSTTEELEPDDIVEAATLALSLHDSSVAVLERLDAEELIASAVVVDGMTTSLRVMRMVADLEVFARLLT